ncbi:MAG: hypothetical protein KF754_00455 [Planctomycetes bacterium]|nr:hypothetical protein [Planctomycetota bacterium]
MSKAVWTFVSPQKADPNVDPVQEEFFDQEDIRSNADALVRESIQNSLDARAGSAPVRVRFTFAPSERGIMPGVRDWYLAGFLDHLRAAVDSPANLPDLDKPIPFLLIEDFGTRGLGGDPGQTHDVVMGHTSESKDPHAFYYFWRNIGRGNKAGSDRGRWGLGKIVFPAASRCRCFFGLTIRATDQRCMLMGQAVLKTHQLVPGGLRFNPYAYFGIRDADNFTMPVEDAPSLQAFRKHFALARGGEPGLSIVIPHPAQDITVADIRMSVLHHYFWPILAGDLIVEVGDGVSSSTLNASTLGQVVKTHDPSIHGLVELARWALDPATKPIDLLLPNAHPKWERESVDVAALQSLIAQYNQMRPIAVRVPVTVRKSTSTAVDANSYFDVFLERLEGSVEPEQAFVRHGMTVSGVTSIRQGGVRGIVNIQDEPLAEFLGDAENVAHTKWEERTKRFKGHYDKGPLLLRFVKGSLKGLVSLLTEAPEEELVDALREFFFTNVSSVDGAKSGQGGKGKAARAGPPALPGDIPAKTPRGFTLSQVAGGFSILGRADAPLPTALEFEVAYARRKNPFGAYSPMDFDLTGEGFVVTVSNARVQYPSPNRVRVIPSALDFSVRVAGFDINRDIIVRERKAKDLEGDVGEQVEDDDQ